MSYGFPSLGTNVGVGRGMVSMGWVAGDIDDAVVIVICLDGNVRVSVGAAGLTIETAVVAGSVLGQAVVAGAVLLLAAVTGNVRTSPLVSGAIRGRC